MHQRISNSSSGENELITTFFAKVILQLPKSYTISTTALSATKMIGCVEYSNLNTRNKSLMH